MAFIDSAIAMHGPKKEKDEKKDKEKGKDKDKDKEKEKDNNNDVFLMWDGQEGEGDMKEYHTRAPPVVMLSEAGGGIASEHNFLG